MPRGPLDPNSFVLTAEGIGEWWIRWVTPVLAERIADMAGRMELHAQLPIAVRVLHRLPIIDRIMDQQFAGDVIEATWYGSPVTGHLAARQLASIDAPELGLPSQFIDPRYVPDAARPPVALSELFKDALNPGLDVRKPCAGGRTRART